LTIISKPSLQVGTDLVTFAERLAQMQALNETLFTRDYVLPIFRARFRGAYYTHGTDEFGRDILAWKTDEMGDRVDKGAQIKVGNITGSVRDAQEIIDQAKAAFSVPMVDESNLEREISELYVITSGDISTNAQTQIIHGLGNPYKSIVHFWDGQRVLQEIIELDTEILQFSVWERYMHDSGLNSIITSQAFITTVNDNLLPACAGDDVSRSPCQIVESLKVMLGALPEISDRIEPLQIFPKQKEAILWNLSWVIITKAYYKLGDVKKFVFE
jgi:hypothetical protein